MGQIKEPKRVTPVASVFTGNETLFAAIEAVLTSRLGLCIYKSERLPFVHTTYYEAEMGPNLTRIIFAFEALIDPGRLPALKNWSNRLEDNWRTDGRRQVNIDLGYVSLAKVVLATTKDHAHRLYLGEGIFGEVTLYYCGGEFQAWPWTYPDYASPSYRKLFNTVRSLHRRQIKVLESQI
ncbi:MAG TPA: DUF4416 family protein [bacterium]|nr:DUF4416 family protein [bacterium]